jgi:hypothetical protein
MRLNRLTSHIVPIFSYAIVLDILESSIPPRQLARLRNLLDREDEHHSMCNQTFLAKPNDHLAYIRTFLPRLPRIVTRRLGCDLEGVLVYRAHALVYRSRIEPRTRIKSRIMTINSWRV